MADILNLRSGRAPVLKQSQQTTQASDTHDSQTEARGESENPDKILRFRPSERILHWSIAVPFMLCYATGIVLMTCFPLRSPGVSRGLLSWTHKGGGALMILLPALTAIMNWRDRKIHFYNIGQAWSWAAQDLKWLILMGAAAVSRKITLPDQGKFNAAEKLNFMMVMCTYPFFILTGVLMWLPDSIVLFWMVHVGLALLATPLMLGHIYMALINPSTRVGLSGMISGYVDRRWSEHHYGRWYREQTGGDATRTGDAVKAEKRGLRSLK